MASEQDYANIPDKYETGSPEEQKLYNEALQWAADNPEAVSAATSRFRSWRNRRKAANMARRCAKGKPRASDVCAGRDEGNGNGSNGDFLGFEERRRERATRKRQRQIFRAAKRLPGAQLTQNGMVRPGNGMAPSANGATTTAPEWWMNPVVWAGAALGAFLLWGRK